MISIFVRKDKLFSSPLSYFQFFYTFTLNLSRSSTSIASAFLPPYLWQLNHSYNSSLSTRFPVPNNTQILSVSTLDTTEENIEYVMLLFFPFFFFLFYVAYFIMYSYKYERIVSPRFSLGASRAPVFAFRTNAIVKTKVLFKTGRSLARTWRDSKKKFEKRKTRDTGEEREIEWKRK